MANIKGFAVKGLLAYVNQKRPGAAADVIRALPADVAAVFDRPILAGQMVPYRVFVELIRGVDRAAGHGDLSICEEIGEFAARGDHDGMFESMKTVIDAKTIYGRAPIFWSRYCDTGKSMVIYVHDNDAATRVEGFPEMDPAHCRLMSGWMRGWALLTYAKSIVIEHPICVSRKGPFCEWRTKWV